MTNQFAKTTALAAALLLGAATISAYALDANVGNGGVSVNTGGTTGGNNATGNIGQGAGSLVTLDSNGNPVDNNSQTDAGVNLGSLFEDGPLVTFNSDGTPTQESSQSDADINLGSLLAGLPDGIDPGDIDVGGIIGGGGTGAGLQAIVSNLSSNDRQALKLRCRDVLASPSTHKADVVSFCKMIAQI